MRIVSTVYAPIKEKALTREELPIYLILAGVVPASSSGPDLLVETPTWNLSPGSNWVHRRYPRHPSGRIGPGPHWPEVHPQSGSTRLSPAGEMPGSS